LDLVIPVWRILFY